MNGMNNFDPFSQRDLLIVLGVFLVFLVGLVFGLLMAVSPTSLSIRLLKLWNQGTGFPTEPGPWSEQALLEQKAEVRIVGFIMAALALYVLIKVGHTLIVALF